MGLQQSTGLSNIQIELLKLYANNIPDEQLLEIRLMLANYFAQKATEAMDKVWEEKKLTAKDMINWTNEHNRISSRSLYQYSDRNNWKKITIQMDFRLYHCWEN